MYSMFLYTYSISLTAHIGLMSLLAKLQTPHTFHKFLQATYFQPLMLICNFSLSKRSKGEMKGADGH
jgi:hypothetical protein